MPAVTKEDTLERLLVELTQRIDTLETSARRRLNAISTNALDSTTSSSYVDLGPALLGIRPGASGKLLVGISAGHYFVQPGQASVVSYRLQSSTRPPVAATDDWANICENGGANADIISVYATTWSICDVPPDGLPDGLYDLVLQVRSPYGGNIDIDGRAIMAMPL